MDAGKRTINDIFNGNRVLEIPFFQRSYVWGIPQWERLLEDMKAISSSNKPYFLGSVILKQQETWLTSQTDQIPANTVVYNYEVTSLEQQSTNPHEIQHQRQTYNDEKSTRSNTRLLQSVCILVT